MNKRFARTMDEAFPYGADYGCAVKIAYRRPMVEKILSAAMYAIFGAFFFTVMLGLMLAYFDVLVP